MFTSSKDEPHGKEFTLWAQVDQPANPHKGNLTGFFCVRVTKGSTGQKRGDLPPQLEEGKLWGVKPARKQKKKKKARQTLDEKPSVDGEGRGRKEKRIGTGLWLL